MLTPQLVELNITELCNRTCSFCPRSQGYPNSNLNMQLELANEIANQCLNFTDNIHLVGRGEPLLHPSFIEIVKIFSHFSIKIVTNGDRLENYIDDLHAVLDLNSGRHKITYCLYDDDEQFADATSKFSKYNDIFLYKTYDTGNNLFDEELSKKQWLDNRAGFFEKNPSKQSCFIPTNRVFIDYNGDINLCCHDWKYKHVYGNVKIESVRQVWQHNMQEVKKQLLNGNRACTSACSECDVNYDPLQKVYSDYIDNQNKRVSELMKC